MKLRECFNKCRQLEQKPDRENQDITQTSFYRMNEAIINFFDEAKEEELDGVDEIGAVDFKLFIIERYYFAFSTKKENREIQRKYFKLMKKYLKNESKDIGMNKYFLMSSSHHEKISEHYYRALIEILICLNENMRRIKEIWEINISSKPERNKIRNSFEMLNIYTNVIIQYHKRITGNKNDKNENSNISTDCLLEFKKQDSLLLESMEQVILFMRKVEKEKIDSNHKGIVVEKFLEFLFQIFSLYLRLKAAKAIQVTKEEAEIMCQSCHFMIKQGSLNTLIDCSLKFFYDLISFTNYPSNSEQQNFFYNEIFKNWKKYFNFELYLQNKYGSETKINSILYYFIRFYNYSFRDNPNNIPLFKSLAKAFEEDGYNMVKKLIQKLNDFEVNMENKVNIISLIYNFIEHEKEKLSFDNLCFISEQIINFFKMLYNLNENSDFIGVYLKEEKQIQKDNYQMDMLKVNLENSEQNNLLYKKYSLNSIFYNLTKGKYDKYIYIKDLKYLYEILKPNQAQVQQNQQVIYSSMDVFAKLITYFKLILRRKENTEDLQVKSFKIDKIANILSKFFFYYFYICEKLKINHQIHEQNDQNKILDFIFERISK